MSSVDIANRTYWVDFIDTTMTHCYASAHPGIQVQMATEALGINRSSSPVSVFISYAHEDGKLKDQLIKHLSALKRLGVISEWHDRNILPGGNWSKQIDSHLESSQIILLFISPDFLASDYCNDVEMARALEKDKGHKAKVIPIFLRPCDWKGMSFGYLQGLPLGAKAVTEWPNRDKAFEAVTQGIRMVIEHLWLPVIDANGPAEVIASEKSAALYQLPPPPLDFTGRVDELNELLEAVKKQGVAITGMYGLGGIGKTALALKIADQLKTDYSDAQIYLDLKGIEEAPLLPKEAMAHAIRSFDLAAKVPEKEAEVAALYRSVLHNKKVLLLMDNAKDEHQVKLLVPPEGSMLIVTSRQHFTLPGLFDKNLNVLSTKDAQDLLWRIAPRLKKESGKTIEELARLCGFLPLALEAVANALKVKINISPAEYAERLKDAHERLNLTAVEASLQSSYQLLSETLQIQFRVLAVFPDTFDAAAAAAVWDTEVVVAQDALGELLLYSLIEFNQATTRYRLHDLVRLFADSCLTAEERESSQSRHAGHYLEILGRADDLYLGGGEAVLKGLALFDVEWRNIEAGQGWSAANAHRDKETAELCSAYPDKGIFCLVLRQEPRQRIGWLEAALMATRSLKDRAGEGHTLGNLGNAYLDLGNYHTAIDYYEKTRNIQLEVGNEKAVGAALGNLGICYKRLGELRRAIKYLQQGLEIARQIRDQRSEAYMLGALGAVYADSEGGARALECFEQQWRVARGIGDKLTEGIGLWNSSLALQALGDRTRAITYAEVALKIYEEIESPMVSKVHDQLAQWREEEKAKSQAAE